MGPGHTCPHVFLPAWPARAERRDAIGKRTGVTRTRRDPTHASFGACFPADDPQLLLFVRLDRPRRAPTTAAKRRLPVTLGRRWRPSWRPGRRSDRSTRPLHSPSRHTPSRHPPPLPSCASPSRPMTLRWTRWPDGPKALRASLPGSYPAHMTVPVLEGVSIRVALRRLHKLGVRDPSRREAGWYCDDCSGGGPAAIAALVTPSGCSRTGILPRRYAARDLIVAGGGGGAAGAAGRGG